MCELIVSRKGHFQRDTEGFDEHNRDGAGCGADGKVDEWVLAAMLGCNLVDHEDRKDSDKETVDKEAYRTVSYRLQMRLCGIRTYQAGAPDSRSHPQMKPLYLAARGAQ